MNVGQAHGTCWIRIDLSGCLLVNRYALRFDSLNDLIFFLLLSFDFLGALRSRTVDDLAWGSGAAHILRDKEALL